MEGPRVDERDEPPPMAAAVETNLVPVILDAVKAKATLGEIAAAMREIFGAYRPRSEA